MLVERSEQICGLDEAREYYRTRLVGSHKITCHGKPITIVFNYDATHLYSIKAPDPLPNGACIVTQPIRPGQSEVRVFSLKRARLMDDVLRAISLFTVSLPGKTGSDDRRVLHGPRLPSGEYMRVVLRKGPKHAWTCVSGFPISEVTWREAMRAKRAKFPPE